MVDRLAVDACPGSGVVLDLDREIAADAFHKEAVLDGNMGMQPVAVQLAMGARPGKLVLGREEIFVIEAVPEIGEPIIPNQPLEGLDVGNRLADAELHEEVGLQDGELREDRILVILVEALEVGLELRVADGVERQGMKGAVAPFVHGKHILQLDLAAQADVHIVTE
jgi:hypothetical protein